MDSRSFWAYPSRRVQFSESGGGLILFLICTFGEVPVEDTLVGFTSIRLKRVEIGHGGSLQMCSRCGAPSDGYKTCSICRAKQRARRRVARQKGICSKCSRPSAPNCARCAVCLRNKRRRRKLVYQNHRKTGLCGDCKRPARQSRCESCVAIQHRRVKPCRDAWQAWKARQTCAECGEEDGRVMTTWYMDIRQKTHNCSDYVWWTAHGGVEALTREIQKCTPICLNCKAMKMVVEENRRRAYVDSEKRRRGACEHCCKQVVHCHQFDFDHVDPSQKSFNISKGGSKSRIDAELKICRLLCKNCHHIRTFYARSQT